MRLTQKSLPMVSITRNAFNKKGGKEGLLIPTDRPDVFSVPSNLSLGKSNFEIWQKKLTCDPGEVSRAFFEYWAVDSRVNTLRRLMHGQNFKRS